MGSKAIKMKDSNGNNFYPCPYYPVGSIYMSVNNINPSNFFGGTWEQIKDTFLLSAGDTYKAGSTGGETTHTLTIEEMPSHTHNLTRHRGSGAMTWGGLLGVANVDGVTYNTQPSGSVGGDQPHNNMPPYFVVYMWKRTA